MKLLITATLFFIMQGVYAQKDEQQITNLSKQKWQWMADKNVDSLTILFHEKSMFVHMGGSWGKIREIDVIKSGNIWYKKAEVYTAQ